MVLYTFSRWRTKPEIVTGHNLESRAYSYSQRLIEPNKSEVIITVILGR